MNYSEALPRLALMLQDPEKATYDEALILNGLNAGLDAILPWVANRQVLLPSVPGGSASELTLPSNVYRILSVYDGKSGYFIPESAMLPSQRPGNNQQSQNAWVHLSGTLKFFASVDTTAIEVVYESTWEHFSEVYLQEVEDVEVPPWSERAIEYYAAYYCYLSKAGATGSVRQYNIQVDSGNPSHNPLADMAESYHKAFFAETKLFPVSQRGQRT